MNNNVGFLGLGKLGRPIAERIEAAGLNLTVYDLSTDALLPFRGRALIATSAADVGDRAEIVFGCLPTLESYAAAITGSAGLCKGGRVRTYVHIGTTGPGPIKELAAELAARGIQTVDAPVTGGPGRARAGTLTTMTSGATGPEDTVMPVLKTYSQAVIRVGRTLGQAQVVKLINNMLSASNLAVACEALAFGAKFGLSPRTILSVVNNGTGMSDASRTKIPEQVLTRRFDFGGSTAITVKDTATYVSEANRAGADIPLGRLVCELYTRQLADGLPGCDMTTIAHRFERAANIEISDDLG